MTTVAVLFARSDSVYKGLAGTDVWDQDRDALKWPGGAPIVAHPPCGPWGRLAQFCKKPPEQRAFALWAVNQVRLNGGALEHPATSKLWPEARLPEPGEYDAWDGFTMVIDQFWFGHRASKRTRLYICGTTPAALPEYSLKIGEAPCVVDTARGIGKGHPNFRPCITKPEREHTPIALAEWLLSTARLCAHL